MADLIPEPTITPVTSQDIQVLPNAADDAKDAADTISSLNKLFDEKIPESVNTQITDEPKVTPIGTEAPKTQDDFETNLSKFKAPDGSHPNFSKGMDELKKISHEEHSKRIETETKLQELTTKLADYEKKINEGVIPEKIQKELEESRQWRREMDLKNDPDFVNNYVKPIQEANKDIMSLLKSAGLKEDTEKFIEENGGLLDMSQSDAAANDNQTLAEWVNDVLLPKTPLVFRNRIIAKLTGAMDVMERGNKELSDWQSNSKERWEAKQLKVREGFIKGQTKALSEIGDLAKPRQIPSDATPELRAEIDTHNNRLRTAEKRFNEYLQQGNNPEMHGEILVKATQADLLMGWNKELQTKLAAAEKRISEIKAAGSHSQAGQHTAPESKPQVNMQDLLKQDDSKALHGIMDKIGVSR
jgi:autonomous glycyl radical cofactor GrcA